MKTRTIHHGDIIRNLWMSGGNHLQTCLYIRYPKSFLVGVNGNGDLWMNPVDSLFKKRMELDEEHWKIVGHCDIEDYLKTILWEQDYDRSGTD